MIKVYIDQTTNKVVKCEPVQYIEKIVDFDINDNIVTDEIEGLYIYTSDGRQRFNMAIVQ